MFNLFGSLFLILISFSAGASGFDYSQYLQKCGGKAYAKCDAPELNQEMIYDAALAEAKATNRQLIADFGADWCTWCAVLDRAIEGNPTAAASINRKVFIVRITADTKSAKAVLARFGGKRHGFLPYYYVIASNSGTMIADFKPTEYLDPQKLDRKIEDVLSGKQ